MIVRPASSEDAGPIAALAALVGTTVDVAAELARPWGRLWVASTEADGETQAFLLAWDAADEVHLIDVVTHTDARRRGLASALLKTLIAHAAGRQAALIALEVRRSNLAAIALYRGAGFRVVGVRRSYYPGGEDALDMLLHLDPDSGAVLRRDDEIKL